VSNPNEEYRFRFHFGSGLSGRTVLIAGGTGGLGRGTAALLAREGASLVLSYRSNRARAEAFQEFLSSEYGTPVELVEGDIGDAEVRRRSVAAADAMNDGIYGLVCFTGDPARVKFDVAEASHLEESLGENYLSPLLLARESAASMQARHTPGAIVLISSMQAVAVFESSINYAGPKAALIHAARILAKQWRGSDGIRVNVVAPGVNKAGMALASIETGKYDPYIEEGKIPRFGRPEDVARAVQLLLEPDNYITGQVMTVDGGLTL